MSERGATRTTIDLAAAQRDVEGLERTALVGHAGGAEPLAIERGSCIHRYVVLDRLGQGGMGVVYKAYDPELDRRIALKLLTVRTSDDHGGSTRDRLLREAQALAQLSHPNVVSIYDVGTYGEDVFIAMELVEGKTLRAWLREHPGRPWRVKLGVFEAAGAGLAAAHRAGLVHRDFKPENVIVGDDGRVCVLDFGLARVAKRSTPSETGTHPSRDAESSDSHDGLPAKSTHDAGSPQRLLLTALTRAGSIMGTPIYMAPEQHLGAAFDARADQFSFCVALYEALHGTRPFSGDTTAKLRKAVLRGEIEPPPPGSPVPRWLRRVLVRGLSAHPEHRFAGMDQLLEALRADPAATWRRVGLAAALPLLGAGSAYGVLAAEPEVAPCEHAGREIDAVWHPEVATGLRAAMLGSGRRHAEATYERVAARLDGFAEDWRIAKTDACEATHVRKEQSEQLLDLRVRCLGRGLDGVRALLAAYADRPEAEAVDNAVEAFDAVTSIGHCADGESLAAAVPLPDDPELRREIDEVFAELARADALQRTGRYGDLAPAVEAALARATELDHAPLLATAQYRAAEMANKQRKGAEAERLYAEAIRTAARAREFRLGADAWLGMLWIVGLEQERHVEAWALRHAAAAAVILAGNEPALEGRLHEDLGAIALQRGDFADAAESFAEAGRLYEAATGGPNKDMGRTLAQQGIAYMKLSRFEAAETSLHRALEIERDVLGPDHPLVATVLNNIGVVYEKQWRFGEAIERYERAREIYASQFAEDHVSLGEFTHNLGVALTREGRLEQARPHLQRAVEVFEAALGPDHPHVGVALKNLGHLHTEAGEVELAVAALERSLRIFEQRLGPKHTRTAESLRFLGLAHARAGLHERSRQQFERARAILEQAVGTDNYQVGEVLTDWGELEAAADRGADARAHLRRAIAILEGSERAEVPLARARFALARTLRADPAGSSQEIEALVSAAEATYRGWDSERATVELERIEQWRRGD